MDNVTEPFVPSEDDVGVLFDECEMFYCKNKHPMTRKIMKDCLFLHQSMKIQHNASFVPNKKRHSEKLSKG